MKLIKLETLYNWAQRKLGPSNCKQIKWVDNASGDLGTWDWQGTIRLNKREIKSNTTLYRVLAHEWTHAQQSYKQYLKGNKHGYWQNPLEVQARRAERGLWR